MEQKIALIVDFIVSRVKPKEIFYRSLYITEAFCGENQTWMWSSIIFMFGNIPTEYGQLTVGYW